jgi:hypothetical protein
MTTTTSVPDVTPTLRIGSIRYAWVAEATLGERLAPFHIALTPPQVTERVVTFCGLAFSVRQIRDAVTADRACANCIRKYSPHRPTK